MSVDLWPDEITVAPEEKAPNTILKEQASALGKKTGNLVEGEVLQVPAPFFGDDFSYRFMLVAPVLDYRLALFTIQHPIAFYPLKVVVETGEEYTVKSEEEFLEALKAVFSSEYTVRVIQSLKAQSTAA